MQCWSEYLTTKIMEEGMGQVKSQLTSWLISGNSVYWRDGGDCPLLKFKNIQKNNRENPNPKGLGAAGSAAGESGGNSVELVQVSGLGKEEPVAHLGCGGRGKALLWLWIVMKSVALEFFVMQNQDNHCSSYDLFVFFRPFHALPMAVIF